MKYGILGYDVLEGDFLHSTRTDTNMISSMRFQRSEQSNVHQKHETKPNL